MSEILHLRSRPDLDDPVLLVALEGWVDAGSAASLAAACLLDDADPVPVAEFEMDELLDHRARRPTMEIVDSAHGPLSWPELTLDHIAARPEGRDVLLLHGAEPDYRWRSFTDAVVTLVEDLGVTRAIGLGAYPAAVPHTRPVRVVATASSTELAQQVGTLDNDVEAPVGVQAVILKELGDRGVDAIACWAQVPHYTAAMSYPAAALALLRAAATLTGHEPGTSSLESEVTTTRARIDELVKGNRDAERLVSRLEQAADSYEPSEDTLLPTGEDLAAELQRFLDAGDGPG